MAHQQAKLKKQKRPKSINRREDDDLQMKRNNEDLATMQFALENNDVSSPETVMQLQRLVGNSQATKLVAPANVIQKGGGYGQVTGDMDSEFDEEDAEEEKEKKSKLRQFGDTLQEYYSIHKNYKKYKKYIGGKAWSYLDTALDWITKATKYIKKVEKSGVTEAINKVVQAVRAAIDYINEAYVLMTQPDTVEQLTPLLPKKLKFSTVKDSVKEAFTFSKVAKKGANALMELL